MTASNKRKLTPYEKIVNAAYHGRSLTLSADEVFELSMDSAISEAAAIKAEQREDKGSQLREIFLSAEREAEIDDSLIIDGRRWCDSPRREGEPDKSGGKDDESGDPAATR